MADDGCEAPVVDPDQDAMSDVTKESTCADVDLYQDPCAGVGPSDDPCADADKVDIDTEARIQN
jgi:hypothetical protein